MKLGHQLLGPLPPPRGRQRKSTTQLKSDLFSRYFKRFYSQQVSMKLGV